MEEGAVVQTAGARNQLTNPISVKTAGQRPGTVLRYAAWEVGAHLERMPERPSTRRHVPVVLLPSGRRRVSVSHTRLASESVLVPSWPSEP